MFKGLDQVLGIHQHALMVYAKRARVISSNMANADTPGFRARDVDFRKVLNSIHETTKSNNSESPVDVNDTAQDELLYRVPYQSSPDGNTVDVQMEAAAFTENAVRFQAVLQILNNKFKEIRKALRGD